MSNINNVLLIASGVLSIIIMLSPVLFMLYCICISKEFKRRVATIEWRTSKKMHKEIKKHKLPK